MAGPVMRRRECISVALAACVGGALPAVSRGAELSQTEAALALRTALERGANAAVVLLGRADGFLGNPKVRIPLPGFLVDAATLLRAAGQQRRVDELELAINRAAEAAVPEATALLVSAARSITVEDAVQIVRGPDDAVTQFFAAKTREPLGIRFLPIVARATERVALARKYNAVASRASALGLLKKEDANLEQHVIGKTLDGLYLMIGEEERKIRRNPVGTGSAILKKVFGSMK